MADFRAAMQVFETIPALDDDDIRVLLRSLGSEQVRRMLALGHGVLMQMDGHYAACIAARPSFAPAALHLSGQPLVAHDKSTSSFCRLPRAAVLLSGSGCTVAWPARARTPRHVSN